VTREDGLRVFVTVHPSYLLRIPDAQQAAAERTRFLDDLRNVAKLMN
jgi:uracil-DNA glycosylase